MDSNSLWDMAHRDSASRDMGNKDMGSSKGTAAGMDSSSSQSMSNLDPEEAVVVLPLREV